MVNVSVTAAAAIVGGPTLPLSAKVGVESYVFSTVSLDAAGGASPEHEVALLPDGGSVALLAVSSRLLDGTAADVSAVLKAGAEEKTVLVHGSLLVANTDALKLMVTNGPRSIRLTNEGAKPIVVDVLAGRTSP